LRNEVEALEKKRKEEWVAKELLMENYMEAELATAKRRRMESAHPDENDVYDLLVEDILPSKELEIEPKAGRMPWWRDPSWLEKLSAKEVKDARPEEGMKAPDEHPASEAE
jgi:hypothetical protein